MKIIVALGVALLSVAAASQTTTPRGASEGLVCKTTGETGSRLQRSRTCKSRAEWADFQRDQRNTIDRAQTKQFNLTIDEKGKMHGR